MTIDNNQSVPFLVGDFNGDNSEDIAITVKPAKGKLSELNGEYVNWIVEDPRQVHHSPEQKKQPVTVGRDDLLLAVIHGYEREGWRSRFSPTDLFVEERCLCEFKRWSHSLDRREVCMACGQLSHNFTRMNTDR